MAKWSDMKRSLTLHELMEEAEKTLNEDEIPDKIIIFPPEGDENTDEDSGDENFVIINNLPGNQLRTEAETEILNPDIKSVKQDDTSETDSDDEVPLSVIAERLKTSEGPGSNVWTKQDITSTLSEWSYECNTQIELSPTEWFTKFFDDEVINLFVQFSNIYANSHNRLGDIQANEMRCFFAILLLSGYTSVSRREMYWENSKDTKNELVCEAMSRNRFRFIMQNIHCCDNNNLNKDDRFAKVRPIFTILNKKFIDFAPKEENHSIDESMVPYYGGHGTKQFIRGKPIRWGYKLWTGTNKYGYIEWFEPYQGANTMLSNKNFGLGASVVLEFAEVLQRNNHNTPYNLYFDNFFTSVNLLKQLSIRGLKGTGTVRENRLGKSCKLPHSSELKKKDRGYFDYISLCNNQMIICKWNDNSVVSIASNNCPVFPTTQVKRFSQKEKKNIYIPQPNIIKKYNENMGGVDRADQNISLYRVSIRGKKWYFPLISHSLDMAEHNAWQLYRSNGGKLDHLGFRRSVTLGILESYKRDSKRGPSRASASLHDYSRYDGVGHLVIYQDKQTRCKLCHKKCNFLCKKCTVALHPKECFILYHSN